jgi:hypothetical protein
VVRERGKITGTLDKRLKTSKIIPIRRSVQTINTWQKRRVKRSLAVADADVNRRQRKLKRRFTNQGVSS